MSHNRNNQSRYPKLETKKLTVTENTDLYKKVVCHDNFEVRGVFKVHGIDTNNVEAGLRTTGTEVDDIRIWGLLKNDDRYIFNPKEWNRDPPADSEVAYQVGNISADPETFSLQIGKEASGTYEFTVNGTVRMGADLRVTITKNPGTEREEVLPDYHTFDESWQQMTLITFANAVRDDVFVVTFEVDCTTEVSVYSLIFKARKV